MSNRPNEPSEREYVLRSILDTAVDAIITIDLHGVVRGFNRAAARMFGYTAEEVVGQNVRMLMPEPYASEHDGYLERYLRTGEAHIIGVGREAVARRKDGTLFPIDLAVSEVDRLGRFTGILRDLTSRRALEREVIECTTLEQQRIGQEIHDNLGQRLTGAAMLAKALERKLEALELPDANTARQVTEQLRLALDEAHRLAHGLQPVDIDPRGLVAALEALAHQIEATSGIRCRVNSTEFTEFSGRHAATHLYRIAQEALQNVVKHAQASEVVITLRSETTQLTLAIEDDGVGIGSGRGRQGGLGLHTMRYRAGIIGAQFSVTNAPTHGTIIKCILPVDSNRER
ncbi:MAG: PAS domain S-box protein [Pirellulales bacterium]|nr:PAS domain S-box protein [Pirellulales bacterium]